MSLEEIGVFTPRDAARAWQATLAVERGGDVKSGPFVPIDEPIQFRNDSGETIPAYACVQASTTEENGGRNLLVAKKPLLWSGALVGPFFFNNEYEVPSGEFGTAQKGPIFRCVKGPGPVIVGIRIGPVANEWRVGPGSMYAYIGNDDVDTDVIRVISNETPLLAITDEEIPGNGEGSVTVKIPTTGDWIGGFVSYEVRNPSPTVIRENKLVMIFPVDAKWAAVELC